jgi:hypothetical protein
MRARESADELAAAGNAPKPHEDLARDVQLADRQAKQQVAAMASAGQSAKFKTENVPAVSAEQEEIDESKKAGNAVTTEVVPAPPAPALSAAPAGSTMSASEDAAKAGAGPQAGPTTVHATTQSVEVTATGGGSFGGEGGAGRASAAKAAPQVAAQASIRIEAQAPMVALRASRKEIESGAGQPSALWSVSSNGKVQRSTDGGKTFEQIQIAHGIKFRAIAAFGNDVWTGGAGGVLFHSTDGGATWSRTRIHFEGNTITETIAGIQLRDPQHLTITTTSGSQWVSEDSGQSWQKQP